MKKRQVSQCGCEHTLLQTTNRKLATKRKRFSVVEIMKLKIHSGKFLLSAIIEEPNEKPKGLTVFLPGYLDSKDYYSFSEFSKIATKLGLISTRFDPTGTWESGGTINDYSITQYIADIEAVINFVKSKHNALENIILIGHSIGGLVAIAYVATHKNVSMIIPIQPPQMKSWGTETVRISQRDLPFEPEKSREYKTPYSFAIDSKKYNAKELISKVTVPIYLITGEKDEMVLPKIVEEIYNNANEPKEYTLLKNVGHNFRKSKKETEIVGEKIEEKIIGWFKLKIRKVK